MFRKRLIVVIFMVPIVAGIAAAGGIVYTGLITIVLALAAWEFWRMFTQGGFTPSVILLIGGTVLFAFRAYVPFADYELLLSLLALVAMTVHLIRYERGDKAAATGFCITVGGFLYLGLLGSYLISVRQLPDGLWWLLVILPAAWFADLGGYFGGRWFGKHALTPRLSPRKTWEGYFGGIILSVIATGLLAALWSLRTPVVTFERGLVIGAVISILVPLGDLGESMFKRQFDLKDSSQIIPGHGGILDRIDTWIWAAAIGYYLVLLFA